MQFIDYPEGLGKFFLRNSLTAGFTDVPRQIVKPIGYKYQSIVSFHGVYVFQLRRNNPSAFWEGHGTAGANLMQGVSYKSVKSVFLTFSEVVYSLQCNSIVRNSETRCLEWNSIASAIVSWACVNAWTLTSTTRLAMTKHS